MSVSLYIVQIELLKAKLIFCGLRSSGAQSLSLLASFFPLVFILNATLS